MMKADFGIAMGLIGTDFLKNAGDLCINTKVEYEDFDLILSAFKLSHNIYDSVRKFIQF